MVFLQLNILAKDREELLKTLDEAKAEIMQTPSLEFFAIARTEAPQLEAVTGFTEAANLWDLRQQESQTFQQADYLISSDD